MSETQSKDTTPSADKELVTVTPTNLVDPLQHLQPDPPKKVISLTLKPLQISEPPPTVQPATSPSNTPNLNDDDYLSDGGTPSPTSKPDGWNSDESYDSGHGLHYMTRHEVRLYKEQRAREKAEPIQAHLEFLHHAFQNVDPKYTIFAFGGRIPSEEVDCKDLKLKVWSKEIVKGSHDNGSNGQSEQDRNGSGTAEEGKGMGKGELREYVP
jgi:hypothetical protein